MDAKIKKVWANMLRSGAFTQGRTQLRDLSDHYDPCGVLCELAVGQGIIPPSTKYEKPDAKHFFGYQYGDPKQNDRLATGLPKAVIAWSGVSYREGMKVSLMGDHGKKFDEIADWIEGNL